jgi:hypothetical protein
MKFAGWRGDAPGKTQATETSFGFIRDRTWFSEGARNEANGRAAAILLAA